MAESLSIKAVLSAVDKDFTSKMNQAADTSQKLDDNVKKTNHSILDIAKGVGVFSLVNKGISVLSNSVGGAIKRFDTLNNYPKVLQSLGAGADDAESSMAILSDGIDGLPSGLDEVSSTAQQMFLVFRDADKSAESTIALNDALLASGSSGDKAARGTEQYLKILRSGKVEMDSWGTLQETMGVALDEVAKSMLGSSASTQDLYSALQSGEVSIEAFNSEMIKLDKVTGGFADKAKTASKGIGTSFKNLANTAVKGVANIITALDNLVKESGINADGIAGIFDVLKGKINSAFEGINKAITGATPYVIKFIGKIKELEPAIPPITSALAGLTGAIVAMKVVNATSGYFNKFKSSLATSNAAIELYSMSVKAGTKHAIAYNAAISGGGTGIKAISVITGALTGKIKLASAAQLMFSKATGVLSNGIKGLYATLGPVAIVIGLVTAAATGLAWWYNKSTEETRNLKKAQEETRDELKESAKAHDNLNEKNKTAADNTAKLKDEIFKLASEENKSAEQKQLLQEKIDSLNGKVEGLGMAYDEEKNSLNLSNQEARKRLELQAKIEAASGVEERLAELQVKRAEATKQVKEAEENYNTVQEKTFRWFGEKGKAEEAATLAKENANEIARQISEEEAIRTEAEKARMQQLKVARNQMTEQGKVNYEDLSDSQKASFDSMKAEYDSLLEKSTNVFEQMKQKEAISLDEMIGNLTKNAEAMNQWSDNIALLAKLGVEDGVIKQLQSMGPEGATQTQVLVDSMTDGLGKLTPAGKEKMNELNKAMSTSIADTTHDMTKILGEGSEPFVAEFEKMSKDSLKSMKTNFSESELMGIGKDINAGVAKGLGVSVRELKEAAKNSANKLDESFRHALGIHSPSRVMIENGKYVIQGVNQGLEENSNLPINTLKNLASDLENSFNNLPSIFTSIGNNTMIGFNNGIVSAGNIAISNARNIANSVSETMRRALDIHSPSRVMMKIGGFVGEGLAIGMERSVPTVEKSNKLLSSASASMSFDNNNRSISTSSKKQPSNLTLNLGNRSFKAFVEDITNVQSQDIHLQEVYGI